MRKDGTHTERELERLDRRVSEIWEELNRLAKAHEQDRVGLSIAYARPKNRGKGDEQTVYGACVAGHFGATVAALTELFGRYPDVFMEALGRIAEKHPESFMIHIASRQNDKSKLS